MNLQIVHRSLLKWARILFFLLLGLLVFRYLFRPHYSYAMRKKSADMLMLTRFNKFYIQARDETWTPCRWTGRIALFDLANAAGGDSVDTHATSYMLPRYLAARSDSEADVIGFVSERNAQRFKGGMLFVVLVEPKESKVMGVVVVKEWERKPTESDFEAEYPHLVEELQKLHE